MSKRGNGLISFYHHIGAWTPVGSILFTLACGALYVPILGVFLVFALVMIPVLFIWDIIRGILEKLHILESDEEYAEKIRARIEELEFHNQLLKEKALKEKQLRYMAYRKRHKDLWEEFNADN